jgi:hypothetical protein
MASKREKIKGRRESGQFLNIPTQIPLSNQYANLGAWSVKLLIDLYTQYNGHNNGDLCAAFSMMQKRGWRSKGTLSNALTELTNAGFILKTRQGGKHKASLYAVTFRGIDECKGKLDINPMPVPPNTWNKKLTSLPAMCTNVPAMCTNQPNNKGV